MSDSFSEFAGAFSGSLTGRPNQPAVRCNLRAAYLPSNLWGTFFFYANFLLLWALPTEQGADRKSWEHGSMMQLPTRGAHTERSPLRHSVLGDTINKNDVPDTPPSTQKEDSRNTHHVSDRVGTVPRRSERGGVERLDVIERLHHASQLHGLSGPLPEEPKNQTSSHHSTRHVSAVRFRV
jgi:hypothetical protein